MQRVIIAPSFALLFMLLVSTATAEKASDAREICLNRSGNYALEAVLQACESQVEVGGDAETLYEAHISLGIALGDRGDFTRAINEFTEAARLLPNATAAYNNRGIAYRNLGNYDAAIADYAEALRINPQHARALNNRCWARAVTARDLDQALEDCDASLRIEPDTNTNATRCLVHLHLHNYAAALSDCDLAHRGSPTDVRALYGRGLAHKGLGMIVESQRDREAALALNPNVAAEYEGFGISVANPANQ